MLHIRDSHVRNRQVAIRACIYFLHSTKSVPSVSCRQAIQYSYAQLEQTKLLIGRIGFENQRPQSLHFPNDGFLTRNHLIHQDFFLGQSVP